MYIPMVGTAAILLTFSRTGMILMMISYLFLLRNTGFWRGFLLCTGVGIMVAVLVYWLNSTDSHVIEQLVTTRITLDNLAEASGRTELWSYLIPLIPEALVFPKGYYSSLYYFYISPHNYLLSVSLEQGIIGLIISMFFFTLLFLYFTPRKLKRPKLNPAAHSKPMFRLMWLIVLMNLFVEDLLGAQPYVFVFWGLFSLSIVEYKKIREGIHRIPYITLPRC